MEWICPGCGARLDERQVNVEVDLAVCAACGTVSAAGMLHSIDELRNGLDLPVDSIIVVDLDENLVGKIELGRMAPRIKTWGLWGSALTFVSVLGLAILTCVHGPADLSGEFCVLALFLWLLVVPIFVILERHVLEVGPRSLVVRRHGVLSSRRNDYAWTDIESIALLSASHDWREAQRPAQEHMASYLEIRACTRWGPIPRGWALANIWFFRSEPTKWLVVRHRGRPTCTGEPCTNAEREWLLDALQALATAHGGRLAPTEGSGRPLLCPNCSNSIPADFVSVAANRATCQECNTVFAASGLPAADEFSRVMSAFPENSRVDVRIQGAAHTTTVHIPRWRLGWNAVAPIRHSPTLGRIVASSLLAWPLIAFLLHREMKCMPTRALIYAAVPVLLASFLKLRSALRPFLTDQKLVLGRAGLRIEQRRLWQQRCESMAYSEIDNIEVDDVPRRALKTGRRCRVGPRAMVSFQLAEHVHFQRAVAIKHGRYVTGFAQWTSPEEMAWLVDLLNAVIACHRQ